MASASFLDHRLDQRIRMDRPRRIRRLTRKPAHRRGHLVHERHLCTATLASILDLHRLQPRRIPTERVWQFSASVCDERCLCVVHHRIRHHFDHGLGLFVSELRQWKVRFRDFHKRYAIFNSLTHHSLHSYIYISTFAYQ